MFIEGGLWASFGGWEAYRVRLGLVVAGFVRYRLGFKAGLELVKGWSQGFFLVCAGSVLFIVGSQAHIDCLLRGHVTITCVEKRQA